MTASKERPVTNHASPEGAASGKQRPDHHDAELVLRVYELRRETVMRQSRAEIARNFWPRSFEDVIAVTRADHPLNAPFRQVGSFWEMVYGMARHGIVHADYFLESNGEGLFLFAKMAPHVERYRAEHSRLAFVNAEWAARETATGRKLFELFAGRVKKTLESR
jgi:hypothetical protein